MCSAWGFFFFLRLYIWVPTSWQHLEIHNWIYIGKSLRLRRVPWGHPEARRWKTVWSSRIWEGRVTILPSERVTSQREVQEGALCRKASLPGRLPAVVLNYSTPWIDSHNGPILIKAIAYLKQSWIQKKQNSSKQFHKTLACCNFFKTRSTFHAYNVNSSLSNVYLQRICPPPSSNSLPPNPCDFFKLLHV